MRTENVQERTGSADIHKAEQAEMRFREKGAIGQSQHAGTAEMTISSGVLIRYDGPAEEVRVPAGVEAIGSWAFKGCGCLHRVWLPESVRRIGGFAFEDCEQLEEADVPAGVEYFGNGVFCGCSSLKRAMLPDSVEKLSVLCFRGCIALTEIFIPKTIKKIDRCAFQDCRNLKRLHVPMRLIRDVPEQIRQTAALTYQYDISHGQADADPLSEYYAEIHAKALFDRAIEEDNQEAVDYQIRCNLIDRSWIEPAIAKCQADGRTALVTMLLDYDRGLRRKGKRRRQADDWTL